MELSCEARWPLALQHFWSHEGQGSAFLLAEDHLLAQTNWALRMCHNFRRACSAPQGQRQAGSPSASRSPCPASAQKVCRVVFDKRPYLHRTSIALDMRYTASRELRQQLCPGKCAMRQSCCPHAGRNSLVSDLGDT